MRVDDAGAVGQPGGDVDDPGADGGRAGGAVAAAGQVPGGAGQVVGDGRAGQPGVVGREPAGGQMRQGSVDEFGVDLLDHRVAPVLGLGLDQDVRGVGNLNVRRYVDISPATEPALDVRAALFGGVPKRDVESEAPKFRVSASIQPNCFG